MAEFCIKCADKFGVASEIDIDKIFKKLKPGYQQSVLCEGCGLVALLKESNLELFKGYLDVDQIKWVEFFDGLV
jgi:hypothetical protein